MCRVQSEVLVQIQDMDERETLLHEDWAWQCPEGEAEGVQREGSGGGVGGAGPSQMAEGIGLELVYGSLPQGRVSLWGCK